MKQIAKFIGVCLMAFAVVSIVSCGSKVNKEELDRKIEDSMNSDKEPEFSDAEYEFMADYLYDNCDNIEKLDINDKDAEIVTAYSFILLGAQMEGKLSKKAQEALKRFNEKTKNSEAFQNYKENEKAIIEALEEADIDWDEALEEAETPVVFEDYEAVVEE